MSMSLRPRFAGARSYQVGRRRFCCQLSAGQSLPPPWLGTRGRSSSNRTSPQALRRTQRRLSARRSLLRLPPPPSLLPQSPSVLRQPPYLRSSAPATAATAAATATATPTSWIRSTTTPSASTATTGALRAPCLPSPPHTRHPAAFVPSSYNLLCLPLSAAATACSSATGSAAVPCTGSASATLRTNTASCAIRRGRGTAPSARRVSPHPPPPCPPANVAPYNFPPRAARLRHGELTYARAHHNGTSVGGAGS